MVDRKLEANIKKTENFLEIWNEFHRIFENALAGNSINKVEEKNFFSTETLVNARYDDLMDSLGVKPIKRFIKSEAIYNILSIRNLSIMSDRRSSLVYKDWQNSFKFLNSLLERLKRKKRRIEGFSRFSFLVKKGLSFSKRRG
ncbi:MAG: hypothetical protein HQ549_05090 [Candidatus Omnitrophica bacterium]|nr:hypothetical protein [Candidatus Omnitrophota bacterium]